MVLRVAGGRLCPRRSPLSLGGCHCPWAAAPVGWRCPSGRVPPYRACVAPTGKRYPCRRVALTCAATLPTSTALAGWCRSVVGGALAEVAAPASDLPTSGCPPPHCLRYKSQQRTRLAFRGMTNPLRERHHEDKQAKKNA
ncbi:hypothetical protein BHE74_00052310 [Ensete ventricosum]|nr:hypothetical protein BHE74_00052310 [Ensete ventricosum]